MKKMILALSLFSSMTLISCAHMGHHGCGGCKEGDKMECSHHGKCAECDAKAAEGKAGGGCPDCKDKKDAETKKP
jgi:hypothetical protein